MNLHRRLFLPLVVAGLFALGTAQGQAEDDRSGVAVAAARNWLTLMDNGKFTESYEAGCEDMQRKVQKDRWVMVLKALRETWGSVLSRQVTSQVIKPDGVNGLNGQCMVITFNTSFKKLDQAQEEVTLKLENGRWFGAGYLAGAKPSPSGSPVMSHTDTQTQIAHP